jgi:5'-nucleotidase
MTTQPLILVTNDDGVHSPGIRALAGALAPLAEVQIVAPDREVSACSQSLTLKHPLRADKIDERIHAVDGTPADCVNLALVKLLSRRPDLLVSGINRGANLGEDVFYSGTVGGAREGTFFGVP